MCDQNNDRKIARQREEKFFWGWSGINWNFSEDYLDQGREIF